MPSEQHLPYRATGHVVRRKLGWHHGHVWLSCGHDGGWQEVGAPMHCPACGAEVVDE